MKNAFFWCIICWCRSKIAKFWNFAHFLAIFSIFSIFAFFLWFVEKKFWKRLKSVGNDPKLCGNMIFDLFVAPEQRKMGGGPQGPLPRPWQGLPDVALIRVKLWCTSWHSPSWHSLLPNTSTRHMPAWNSPSHIVSPWDPNFTFVSH